MIRIPQSATPRCSKIPHGWSWNSKDVEESSSRSKCCGVRSKMLVAFPRRPPWPKAEGVVFAVVHVMGFTEASRWCTGHGEQWPHSGHASSSWFVVLQTVSRDWHFGMLTVYIYNIYTYTYTYIHTYIYIYNIYIYTYIFQNDFSFSHTPANQFQSLSKWFQTDSSTWRSQEHPKTISTKDGINLLLLEVCYWVCHNTWNQYPPTVRPLERRLKNDV